MSRQIIGDLATLGYTLVTDITSELNHNVCSSLFAPQSCSPFDINLRSLFNYIIMAIDLSFIQIINGNIYFQLSQIIFITLILILVIFITNMQDNSNRLYDIEAEAKRTLAFFSNYDQNYHEWDYDRQVLGERKRNLKLLKPIKNVKTSRQQKYRSNNSQASYQTRTPLVPSKVSLEKQTGKSKKNLRTSCPRTAYLTIAKQNYKPHKTIRNNYSLTRQAQQKQEEQGFDFMQYWIRHRFEDGAITALVEKLRDNKNNTILRL